MRLLLLSIITLLFFTFSCSKSESEKIKAYTNKTIELTDYNSSYLNNRIQMEYYENPKKKNITIQWLFKLII